MRKFAIAITACNILFFFIAPMFFSLVGANNSFMKYFFTVALYSLGIGIFPFILHTLIIGMNTVIAWSMYKVEHQAKPLLILSLVGFSLNTLVFFIVGKALQ
ncbi:hypothetical protein [Dendrosporobacter sp. 1207_IL3150]|uniref:hypothetical protein n=1 Tax=Dendrosporobacter sp. 1207_IL3150 TaxID=3084054 RepID=UPI002FD90A8E